MAFRTDEFVGGYAEYIGALSDHLYALAEYIRTHELSEYSRSQHGDRDAVADCLEDAAANVRQAYEEKYPDQYFKYERDEEDYGVDEGETLPGWPKIREEE